MNLFEAAETEREVYDYLMELAATSERINYCGNCPLLRYEEDTGAHDCEYGGDVESCEYSPSSDIQKVAERFWDSIMVNKP